MFLREWFEGYHLAGIKIATLYPPSVPESLCLRKTTIWLTSLIKVGHFIWGANRKKWRVFLATARASPTFVSLRMKADITKYYHCIRISPPANRAFSACLYCHRFMKVSECGLWLDVLENSQGEEPFISQASAITEACTHRHNHLLELLKIGSPKWYGLGVHHSIQGNFCRCHSNKNLSCWLPVMSTGHNTWNIYFLLLLSYKINVYLIATVPLYFCLLCHLINDICKAYINSHADDGWQLFFCITELQGREFASNIYKPQPDFPLEFSCALQPMHYFSITVQFVLLKRKALGVSALC